MHYESPQAADMDNVRALNKAFLNLLRRSSSARESLSGLQRMLLRQIVALSPREAQRLAEVPFLLFSFREQDQTFWRSVFESDPNEDLFSASRPLQEDVGRLIAAGLGFIWQLARQNPYSLRLLCGATVHWCEQISEHTLVQLLSFATANHDLLVFRLENRPAIWRKLLDGGVHHHVEVRRAAHISALQSVLTQAEQGNRTAWASAACRAKVPTMVVSGASDD